MSTPARFVFVRTKEAKARLRPALAPGNVEKTMTAPVTLIIAYDLLFYEKLVALSAQQVDAQPVRHQPAAGRSHGAAQFHAARRVSDDGRAGGGAKKKVKPANLGLTGDASGACRACVIGVLKNLSGRDPDAGDT